MTMRKMIAGLALIALAFATDAMAQTVGRPGGQRGYVTDSFEGFSVVDNDTRIPQKKPSFWWWKRVKKDTAAAQLSYAQDLERNGKLKKAARAYRALVGKWPTSHEALKAQHTLAQVEEKLENYATAFDEYQYLLVHYAGNCPYEEILDRQFRLANHLLHGHKSMFGLKLSLSDEIRERFETIVRNAPRSPRTPEVMLIIGSLREENNDRVEAIAVYDGILNRFPASKEANEAAFLSARCRHALTVKQPENEARCRESIAFITALLERRPNHPCKSELQAWLTEQKALLVEQNYRKAVFYDSKQRSLDAAKNAYRRFLSEFGDSKYGPVVKKRLAELESGNAVPLRN